MDDSFEDPPPAASKSTPRKFQFGLWQILALTLVVSVIAAWLRLLPFREEHLWAYLLYFGSLAAYVVLRIPFVTGQVIRARKEMAQKKAAAIADAEQARQRKRAGE
ncbi:hypothetical protein [Blastopirellula retiformator]|uniref:Uncharacterized protein n=1 Tax=Blastopirellula retiformator TaxID=2527970 RepID=A0A5C5V4W0_9BACT|nr:hypothetical protein [Blastopirellula retiformator]TWT32807.1 hypothetical protein Enr8_26130 [Blastopirellula retiformator]